MKEGTNSKENLQDNDRMNDEKNMLEMKRKKREIRSDSGTSGEIERVSFGVFLGIVMTSEETEPSCLSNISGISFKREESDEL